MTFYCFPESYGSGKTKTNAGRKRVQKKSRSQTPKAAPDNRDETAKTTRRKPTKTKSQTSRETAHGPTAVLEKIIPSSSSIPKPSNKQIKKIKKPIEQSYLADVIKSIIREELQNHMVSLSK